MTADPVERIARVLAMADGYDPDHVWFPDPDMILGGMFGAQTAGQIFKGQVGKPKWRSYERAAQMVLDELRNDVFA